MNMCLKCQSLYEKPGTCNCYAPKVSIPSIWEPDKIKAPQPSVTTTTLRPENTCDTVTVRMSDGKWFDHNGVELQVSAT